MKRLYRNPHRFKRKKSLFNNRFFRLGILIFLAVGVIFYFLFFSEIFQVEKIIITGERKVSKEELKPLVENKLEKKILFFKTKSIFLVDLKGIREDILNNFPQIAKMEVRREFPNALYLLVIERLGLAIWCQEERCFLLDNEGVIFEPVSNGISDERNGNQSLIRIIEKRDIDSFNLGKKVIEEKEELSQILKIAPELKSKLKIPIKEFIISSSDKLIVVATEGWEIYFNFQGDVDWQITKLGAVLEEKIPPEKRKDLEYIELRFDRVYYKYK